jgi:aryl-alcohol dehydrogenase-like predicted oxidoreductase
LNYRPLGKTGLQVSHIGLGTVALGVDYGIEAPGDFGCPNEQDALGVIRAAAEAGINWFDTAPRYGRSEQLLGRALRHHAECRVATKVNIPADEAGRPLQGNLLRRAILDSLDNSRRALQRDVLDIVQIHNATVEVITRRELPEILLDVQRRGIIQLLGASVYTEAEAMAVIRDGSFQVLQIAYNLLDQRMARRVFPAAVQAGVGIVARSALLKGVLTSKSQWLPPRLAALRQATERAQALLGGSWQVLPEMALRFCLSAPKVAVVLTGARILAELGQNLTAECAGPLPVEWLLQAPSLALSDDYVLNPTNWGIA